MRYRIKYVDMPTNADPCVGFTCWWMSKNAIVSGNQPQVQVGGEYTNVNGRPTAFLYDPSVDPYRGLDVNSWFFDANGNAHNSAALPESYPSGFFLSKVRAINANGVMIGTLSPGYGNCRGFAVDLRICPLMLDLLPTKGTTSSRPVDINDNGDILMAYRDAAGTWQSFLFSPGVYGAIPIIRDGTPYDFSDEVVGDLPLSGDSTHFLLKEGLPVQVAGVTADGLPFRYTVGDDG